MRFIAFLAALHADSYIAHTGSECGHHIVALIAFDQLDDGQTM